MRLFTAYGPAQLAELIGVARWQGQQGFLIRPLNNGRGDPYGLTVWTERVAVVRPYEWAPFAGAPGWESRWAYRVSDDTWVREARRGLIRAAATLLTRTHPGPCPGCLVVALRASEGPSLGAER
jgi:hypothetical protein